MDKALFLSNAQNLLEHGDYESALDAVKQWLKDNPGDVDALIVQCRACMRLGRLEEAAALMEDVEMTILGLSRVYACMGDICFKGGLNQEAGKFYRRFLALNPDSDLSRDISGKLQIVEEDQPGLIREIHPAEMSTPPVTVGFQTLTMVDLYVQQGHLDAAESLLKQMLIKAPEDPAIQQKLKNVLVLMSESTQKTIRIQQRDKVAETLNRWLNRLQRRRLYAV